MKSLLLLAVALLGVGMASAQETTDEPPTPTCIVDGAPAVYDILVAKAY